MITKEFLLDEYGDALRQTMSLKEERESLSEGSLQKKHINGCDYVYLARREDGRVVTTYIEREEVDRVAGEIERRRFIDETLKQLKEERRLIERALGREKACKEHIRRCVCKVVEENPQYGVERVTLFGSRATAHFRDDSDADLLVKFRDDAYVSLLTLSGLRLKFMEGLGMDVDLIEEPLPLDTILEIGRKEVMYGTQG